MNNDLSNEVQKVLAPNETVQWIGVPNPMSAARKARKESIVGVIWTGLLIFMYTRFRAVNAQPAVIMPGDLGGPSSFGTLFTTILIVMMLIGVGIILMPFWRYLKAKNLVYAVTNQRALIINRVSANGVQTYSPGQIRFVKTSGDQAEGDVIFDRHSKKVRELESVPGSDRMVSRTRTVTVQIGFFDIPEPDKVAHLLLALKGEDAPQSPKPAIFKEARNRYGEEFR
jgi:hypothetical protein